MRLRFLALFAGAALFVACGPPPIEPVSASAQALQTCITVQRGQASWGTVADAELRAASPTSNYGSLTSATIGIYSGAQRQELVRWDLSGVPSNAIVSSATATIVNNFTSGASTVNAYGMGAAWTESTVTWTSASAPIGGSSLASASNSGTAGASFALDLTAAAAGWVATPASNNGVALDSGSVANNLVTSEGTTASRPKLVLCYALPSQCSDGAKDGAETDVDCGGSTCSPCANGLTCAVPADCASTTCAGTTCTAPPGDAIQPVTSCTFPTPGTFTGIDLAYGTDPADLLTIWLPTGTPPANGWPVNIDVHGGGGNADGGGRLQSAMVFHARVLATQGIAAISVDYPLFSGSYPSVVNAFPAQLNSMRTLACYLQSIAATYALDMTKIAWSGYSFGANLTGLLVSSRNTNTLPHGTTLAAPSCSLASVATRQLVYYGNVNMAHDVTLTPVWWSASSPNEWQMLNVSGPSDPNAAPRAADATVALHTGDPPILILDGANDTVVLPAAMSWLLAQAQGVGVPSTWIELAGVAHGFSPFFSGSLYTTSNCTSDAFLLGM